MDNQCKAHVFGELYGEKEMMKIKQKVTQQENKQSQQNKFIK